MRWTIWAALVAVGTLPAFALGQAADADLLPGRPDPAVGPQRHTGVSLAPLFESRSAGIQFQPPAGGRRVRDPNADPTEIARFVAVPSTQPAAATPPPIDPAGWTLSVTSTELPQAAVLVATASSDNGQYVRPRGGMLGAAAEGLLRANPAMEVLREDVVNLGANPVGILAVRYDRAGQGFCEQQAIIQASPQLFYTLTFVTPTTLPPRSAATSAPAPEFAASMDSRDATAAKTFEAVLDSVVLLDRSDIRTDQEQRLYRTRAFFVNLTPQKLNATLVPEQWFRITENGHDVGSSYEVQERDTLGGQPAIKVGQRSWRFDVRGNWLDTETWNVVTDDHRHETWSNVAAVRAPKKPSAGSTPTAAGPNGSIDIVAAARYINAVGATEIDHITEFGSTDAQTKAMADQDFTTEGARGVKVRDQYTLSVTTFAKSGGPPPLKRDLPPFYLPQALGQMLPMLLPLDQPKGYLFAMYVHEHRDVRLRYVDVIKPRFVDFAGQHVYVGVVQDRITLDGPITEHYVSVETGKYLGSRTMLTDADGNPINLEVQATDAATLNTIWERPDLSRPAQIRPPADGQMP